MRVGAAVAVVLAGSSVYSKPSLKATRLNALDVINRDAQINCTDMKILAAKTKSKPNVRDEATEDERVLLFREIFAALGDELTRELRRAEEYLRETFTALTARETNLEHLKANEQFLEWKEKVSKLPLKQKMSLYLWIYNDAARKIDSEEQLRNLVSANEKAFELLLQIAEIGKWRKIKLYKSILQDLKQDPLSATKQNKLTAEIEKLYALLPVPDNWPLPEQKTLAKIMKLNPVEFKKWVEYYKEYRTYEPHRKRSTYPIEKMINEAITNGVDAIFMLEALKLFQNEPTLQKVGNDGMKHMISESDSLKWLFTSWAKGKKDPMEFWSIIPFTTKTIMTGETLKSWLLFYEKYAFEQEVDFKSGLNQLLIAMNSNYTGKKKLGMGRLMTQLELLFLKPELKAPIRRLFRVGFYDELCSPEMVDHWLGLHISLRKMLNYLDNQYDRDLSHLILWLRFADEWLLRDNEMSNVRQVKDGKEWLVWEANIRAAYRALTKHFDVKSDEANKALQSIVVNKGPGKRIASYLSGLSKLPEKRIVPPSPSLNEAAS
ncbi:hypothetical protein CCR75_004841 [Bremia lactucae]|uniref:Uncharacterized protein n=1 Tax=Bremia lactucae TaxID=4779 RepID=A0A976ID07_BRELC|nr:hypothetical protein CCR75_004841 [Bremia lactucae]